MFGDLINRLTLKAGNFILKGARPEMTDREWLEREIRVWRNSPQRIMQMKGQLYYQNDHDILMRRRTMIGADGELEEVKNLPNNRVIDNQYAKMVSQKTNYLFGQPVTVKSENDLYTDLLKKIFNRSFMRTLKNSGKAAYNGGIAWLYPYQTDKGELAFRVFPAHEILPYWQDSEHTILDFAVRMYTVTGYEGTRPVSIEKVEIYDPDGIHRFVLDHGSLIPDLTDDLGTDCFHVMYTDAQGKLTGYNWSRVPLIPLKANEQETPLLKKIKTLQDGINMMLSDFQNNMQEDARNTILVLKNYDGTDLGEFRRNLATYGAIKIRYEDNAKGGVETLEIAVNAENYKAILDLLKKALIENAMGYDAKDDRLSGNPNQMNIQSMYSDIDIDANDTETEYQAAFDDILWFVNAHLANTGKGSFENEDVTIIFNRDILINETEAIANCQASVSILSDETIVEMHPWVDDPQKELERLEKQHQKEQEEMMRQFPQSEQNPQTEDDPQSS